ncbi:hypothetical protein BJ878DRAFT_476610 [Calycina marina]|uniref:Uncharacterized protein n=1 Tax=Calycina marina TaxID=1763456 RepID=A0A9P7ZAA4_9HELO|nr:hypothetical protein BJ878DRAFT_476610 [Calycina marina]
MASSRESSPLSELSRTPTPPIFSPRSPSTENKMSASVILSPKRRIQTFLLNIEIETRITSPTKQHSTHAYGCEWEDRADPDAPRTRTGDLERGGDATVEVIDFSDWVPAQRPVPVPITVTTETTTTQRARRTIQAVLSPTIIAADVPFTKRYTLSPPRKFAGLIPADPRAFKPLDCGTVFGNFVSNMEDPADQRLAFREDMELIRAEQRRFAAEFRGDSDVDFSGLASTGEETEKETGGKKRKGRKMKKMKKMKKGAKKVKEDPLGFPNLSVKAPGAVRALGGVDEEYATASETGV